MAGQQTTVELEIGSDFAGYRIEEVAARGGMGVVYRASQLRLTRTVALKLVTPALARDRSFRERFRREWMIAASIDHPNVIPVYEAGEEDGVLYIAMRWVEGTNLRDLIDRGALDPARAAHLVFQVANALDAAHERDLIHRDVKPANILITGQDHVYLSDFGLTKHASSISGLTRTGQWVGTVDYTAPEQIEEATVSSRTDVYSLGCVLFEALTGRPAFKRENDLATLWAHVYTAPPSVLEVSPDIPARFDDVVQRAMAKDPADRYASAGELGAAVQAAAGAPATDPPPPPGLPPARLLPGRPGRRVLLGLAGLLLLIAALVAAVSLSGGGDEKTESDRATPASSPPLRAASTWRPLPSMPTARQNGAGTVLDGTIWVVGGLGDGSTGSRRVEGYDPVINDWKAAPNLPVRLHHEMVVTYKEELVVLGGWIPKGSDQSAVESDRVFVLRDGKWAQLPSLRRPRVAGAAAVVGDRIVVTGGQADGRLVDTTEVFDGKQWKSGANIPTPREHVAAASDGDYLYVVGGRALSPDKNSAALERYDPAADRWQRLPDMPTARGGLGAAIADGDLFAVGGENSTRAFGAVESYNIARKAWSDDAPSMRTARHGIAVAAIGRSLYALGGAPHPGHASAVRTAEVTSLVPARRAGAGDTAGATWRRLPPMPTARQNGAGTVLDGTVWVVGGLGVGSIGSRRVEGYDPVINAWKTAPPLPVRLHHEMVVSYKEEAVVMGGWIPKGGDPSAQVSDRVFALRDGRWTQLPSLRRPRAAAAAAVVGDRIVVTGGQADDRLVDTTEVFDGKRWKSAASMPTPREHLAAVSDGDYVYVVGGRALGPDKNSAALERYEPAADRWLRLPDMPTARGGLGAAIVDGHLFALGGETPTRALGAVESYNIARKAWSRSPSMRTPRHGIAVAAIGNSLYALGGAPHPGHASATATAEVTRLGR